MDNSSHEIISVHCAKGRKHDFELFKENSRNLRRNISGYADLGYQGIQKAHPNIRIPHKKPKGKSLKSQQRKENKVISRSRVPVENIIRCCKIFRIAKGIFRGKHKNYGKTWNIVAGIVNLRRSEGTPTNI